MSIVKLNNQAVKNATAFGSITGLGSMTFIKKLTASSSSTLSFVNGSSDVVLDSTYKEYLFTFKDIHPQNDGRHFRIGFRDGGTDYDATTTTTYFNGYHEEGDGTAVLQYEASIDQAQSTDPVKLNGAVGYDNDECLGGYLRLFNPSSTTFVKHFISEISSAHDAPAANHCFAAGYCNVTAAIDAVQFTMNTGNIDAGDICLYGIL
jgi:hypothetical protein